MRPTTKARPTRSQTIRSRQREQGRPSRSLRQSLGVCLGTDLDPLDTLCTEDSRLHFVPESGLPPASRDLTFGRPPHRRLWRGCAALLAGVEADPRGGRRGTLRNPRGRSALRSDVGGMRRKGAAPTSFYTERSLAAYLTVSDRTIRNWIRKGDLPSYKLGAARRIDPADVEDFLARHRDEAS